MLENGKYLFNLNVIFNEIGSFNAKCLSEAGIGSNNAYFGERIIVDSFVEKNGS